MTTIAQIIIKITERSYNLLKKCSLGGGFKRQTKYKDGYYYIEIDKKIYDTLKRIDEDFDKSIFYAFINNEIAKNNKVVKKITVSRFAPNAESLKPSPTKTDSQKQIRPKFSKPWNLVNIP